MNPFGAVPARVSTPIPIPGSILFTRTTKIAPLPFSTKKPPQAAMRPSTGSSVPMVQFGTSGIAATSFATTPAEFAASPGSPATSQRRNVFRKLYGHSVLEIETRLTRTRIPSTNLRGNIHNDDWKQTQGNSRTEEPFAG